VSISRRGFLKGTISGVAFAGTSALAVGKFLAKTTSPKQAAAPGIEPDPRERFAPFVCTACSAGCGLLLRVVHERAVTVIGNPLHPLSRGATCPRGAAAVQIHYHPDRLLRPRVRESRGASRFREVSWDEAITLVATRLAEQRSQGEA